MPAAKSVIITCAGIGSRLGLGCTKALLNINGRSLISWQLELLKNIDDIRIVVGFQANEVINEVLKYRNDVIFVYNHNYFDTKTAASLYLGARHANELVLEYDGDLLIHPDDLRICLQADEEFIGYSEKMSDEAVYVKLNDKNEVVGFSRMDGDYEWTGPACIKRNVLKYSSGDVFNLLEERLPVKGLKVRACDIDTYDDYERAINFIKDWPNRSISK